MFFYEIEGHMQKLSSFGRVKKNDQTRQDKTFIIKISPVQFLGMQLAENASRSVSN